VIDFNNPLLKDANSGINNPRRRTDGGLKFWSNFFVLKKSDQRNDSACPVKCAAI
jgi:hypothetical protein